MTIITQPHVHDYYYKDPNTDWYCVNFNRIQFRDEAAEISQQCVSDARMERLKAMGAAMIAGGAAGLAIAGFSIVYKISSLLFGLLALPLILIPPLYGLVTILGGVTLGGVSCYLFIKNYAAKFFDNAQNHWNYGNHLYSQAHKARLLMPSLLPAKA